MIKDCGMNFIRGSHYPHHTVFADECDKQGILFWSELCFWGIGGCKGDGYALLIKTRIGRDNSVLSLP